MAKHTAAVIADRRQKLWTLLIKGMKVYEIAKELNTDHSTVSKRYQIPNCTVTELSK